MRRMAAVLFLLSCTGCGTGVNQVEYIIPNGFSGVIKIIHVQKGEAPEIPKANGCYVIHVPEDGVFYFSGYDPFTSYLPTAKFANGEPIWVSTRIDDRPEKGMVGLLAENTVRGSTTGWVSEYRIFIGTAEQWNNAKRQYYN